MLALSAQKVEPDCGHRYQAWAVGSRFLDALQKPLANVLIPELCAKANYRDLYG